MYQVKHETTERQGSSENSEEARLRLMVPWYFFFAQAVELSSSGCMEEEEVQGRCS